MFGQAGITGGLPASAHDDCQRQGSTNGSPWTCGYTQLDPGRNWPWDGSDPRCGVCAWWDMPGGRPGNVDADFSGIPNSGNGAVRWNDDLLNAMYAWSGQPYNSPWMYQCGGSNCQYSQVHDGWKDEGWNGNATPCGIAYVYVDSASRVTSSTIMYNNNGQLHWWDGPPANGQYGCDAKSTAYHEEGHVFTLGHSSVASDVMYWGGGDVTSVTGNAQNGLNAIYGPYQGNSNSGGGCSSCRFEPICRSTIDPCNPLGTFDLEGYLAKAWDLSQGVSLPNPVSYAAPPVGGCMPYWYAEDFTNWSTCAADYIVHKIPNPIP